MSRRFDFVVSGLALLCGITTIATAAGNPAHASPDDWSPLAFAALLPSLAAIGFFPGWFALARARWLGAWSRIALAVFLSLLAATAAGAVALVAGAPLAFAARALAAVTAVLALASLLGVRRTAADATRGSRIAAVLVVAFVLLVCALYAVSPELRPRADGWFHAAVTAHVAQVGVPPDDPWYAGLPLHYAWAMHVAVGVLVAGAPAGATALGVLAGWSALTALALAASVVAAGVRWAHASGEPARAKAVGAWTLALTVCAVHPLGFWIWIPEALIGHVRGWGVFFRPLHEGAGDTLQALATFLPHASLAFFPDKFLIPTSFGLAYAAIVTALDALFLAPWSTAQRALVAGTALVAALVFHPFAGGCLLVGLGLSALLDVLGGRRASVSAITAAAAGALLVSAPYLVAVFRGRVGGAGPWLTFAPDMLLAVVLTGIALLPLAALELRRAGGLFAPGRARVGLIASLWLVAAVVLGLVHRNETKFVSLGLLALALPAGAAAARRTRLGGAVLAVAAPSMIFAIVGFAGDGGQGELAARVPSTALATGYAWVEAHTDSRDVFLEAQRRDDRDPVRDLLVHGPRPLVWGGDSYSANWGYPPEDLAPRRRASIELADGALSDVSVRWLAERFGASGGSVYAVERGRGGVGPRPLAKPGLWTRVYAGPAFALDRLDAPPSVTAEAR